MLDQSTLDKLASVDSSTIANLIELFDVQPRVAGFANETIKALYPDLPPVVGYDVMIGGLAVAQGDLIAIVDSDDVCLPDRFEKQVGFLEAHPEIDFLGGGTTSIDERGRLIGKSACGPVYEQPHLYREDLLAGKSVLITTTWMFRRRVLESVSGFRWYPGWGDRAFSMQASRYYNMYNLQDVLVYRRRHSSSATYRDGYGSMLGKSLRKIFTAQEYLWTQKKIEKLKQAQEA